MGGIVSEERSLHFFEKYYWRNMNLSAV